VEKAQTQKHDRLLRRHPHVVEGCRADVPDIAPPIIEDEAKAEACEEILEVVEVADDTVEMATAARLPARDELTVQKTVRRLRQLLGGDIGVLVDLARRPA